MDEHRDDVEPAGERLDGAGEELLVVAPGAAGGSERADERGVGREVVDVGEEEPELDLALDGAVEGWAELEFVVAPEVGLELAPALL